MSLMHESYLLNSQYCVLSFVNQSYLVLTRDSGVSGLV